MAWYHEIAASGRALFNGRTEEQDMDEEMRYHIEQETERLVAEGVAPDEARRRAMVAFGWPVGPFTLMDEGGLAVARHAGETVAATLGVSAQRAAVDVLVKEGLEGKRKGAGFYLYEGKKKTVNARMLPVSLE